jgi:hypothetical protein
VTPRLAVLMLVVGPLSLSAAEPIAPAQFVKLRGLIKPEASEDKWTRIPWRSDLWEARQEAARAAKPILLWEMDGHPLGCT